MAYLILIAVLVALGVGLAWRVSGRGTVFVVRIRNGQPSLQRGRVSQGFVAELADVLAEFGVRQGTIYGVKRGGRIALDFSRAIPKNSRQALRNVWAMHGR